MCFRTILTPATLLLASFAVAGWSGAPATQPLSSPSHRATQTGSVSGAVDHRTEDVNNIAVRVVVKTASRFH
jgi:hypothetical protein